MAIQVVRYAMSELRENAHAFLVQHDIMTLPINIEDVVDRILALQIVPLPGLNRSTGLVGFLASDCTEIAVDEQTMEHFPYIYRFTLAHEIAHYLLHRDIVRAYSERSVEQWKRHLQTEDATGFEVLEKQADEFARALLIPGDLLREAVTPYVEKAAAQGVDLRVTGRAGKKFISQELDGRFQVMNYEILMRLEDEDLP